MSKKSPIAAVNDTGRREPAIGPRRTTRAEADVFADLERLCRCPGFIHAIAHMCMRDNMIGYTGQATGEDMLKLYDPSRLLRNEMNVLIGLLVKGDIDFSSPDQTTVEAYIDESRKLSEEMHGAMNAPLASSIRGLFKGDTKDAPDPLQSGVAMREAIFYGGESAYAFQYRDFAPLRYGDDDSWIVENMGFSMKEAEIVARAAARTIDKQATAAIAKAKGNFKKLDSPLDIFTLTIEDVSTQAKLPVETCERVLNAFSYPVGDRNAQFRRVDSRNTAAILPVLRRKGGYLLFNAVDLYEVLYQAPYFWMLKDRAYQPAAAENRGKFTEKFAEARLASVFGRARTHLNVKLLRSSDVVGEIDVLVVFSNLAIVLQAKSKQLTAAARQGNEQQIQEDFAAAVQNACDQGMDCAKLLFNPSTKLLRPDGQTLERPCVEKVFVVCLVADHYPALAAQARQFLKFEQVQKVAPPLVMDVFLLDAMAEMLDSPLYFLSYLDRRCSYHDKVMASHELNILGYHVSHNLWLDQKANLFHLWDDFGIDLELSMLARRDGLSAPWTPSGILTLLDQTALGKLVKQIERRPEPSMVELGFSILSMSGETVKQISGAIDEITRLSRLDGGLHDFTLKMPDGGGLTFHSSPFPEQIAKEMLLGHASRRKYVERSSRWFGVVVDPVTGNMRFGVMLDSPWSHDPAMDRETAHMARRSNITPAAFRAFVRPDVHPKIGRNAPCPCGSGKKSKRCCSA